jgi:hypothetical protein
VPENDITVRIDAKTFQEPLGLLAATMVEKVFREGVRHIAGPSYAGEDIATILRYGASVYNLLNYLNADVRRKEDCYWYPRYGVTAMSLVRSLIDCLYNITAILENPAVRAPAYRKSGLRRTLNDLDEDYQTYRGQTEWETSIEQRRKSVEFFMRLSGFSLDEVLAEPMWPTLGTYVRTRQPDGSLTENQQFLKRFTHLEWRQYSALAHAAYEAFIGTLGHLPVGVYYMNDFLPREERAKVEESYDLFLALHLGRSATVLLCLLTELQARCRFDGANINERICKVWDALVPLFEAKELYDGRYRRLMQEKGILPRTE